MERMSWVNDKSDLFIFLHILTVPAGAATSQIHLQGTVRFTPGPLPLDARRAASPLAQKHQRSHA